MEIYARLGGQLFQLFLQYFVHAVPIISVILDFPYKVIYGKASLWKIRNARAHFSSAQTVSWGNVHPAQI
jgi:hypothetical protein